MRTTKKWTKTFAEHIEPMLAPDAPGGSAAALKRWVMWKTEWWPYNDGGVRSLLVTPVSFSGRPRELTWQRDLRWWAISVAGSPPRGALLLGSDVIYRVEDHTTKLRKAPSDPYELELANDLATAVWLQFRGEPVPGQVE